MANMHIALLHDTVEDGDGPDRLDVLVQLEAVAEALERRGHHPRRLACDLDLGMLRSELERIRPDVVFNLVESLAGQDRLIALVPALVESLGLPLTGAPSLGLAQSTSKLASKRMLARAGIPVPTGLGSWPPGARHEPVAEGALEGRVIVKSVWEHGSPGLDDAAVLPNGHDLERSLERMAPRFGGACFAEPYIEGREINLSLLVSPNGEPSALPPAEILFLEYPPGKPNIVGFRAKWVPASFEYASTPRSFEFPEEDRELLLELEALAVATWHVLGLAGWARVDFRVDALGRPFVLEANANPCLSPDAGFAAALERAAIPFDEAIDRLLDDAVRRCGTRTATAVSVPAE